MYSTKPCMKIQCQTIDLEMDQRRQDYYHSEPCIIQRGPNISQPNIHTMVAASRNTSNIDCHYSADAYDSGLMYGMTQFNGIHHQLNLDVSVAASSSSLYFSAITPASGAGVVPQPINYQASDQLPTPQPINYQASDQLPAPGTYAVSGILMDDARCPYKQKMAEGIRGHYQHFNAAASSSSIAPPNASHTVGVAASFSLPQFRGNHIPPLVEIGPNGSLWNRSGDSVMVQEHNHLIPGNYLGQHFQPARPPWLEQQLNGTNNEGHNMAWNQSHPMPNVQAVNANSLENVNTGMQRYHDTASNRGGLRFAHPPSVNHQRHSYHLPTLPIQGVRGYNINFPPPVSATTYRGVPSNSSHSNIIPVQNGFGLDAGHAGPAPSASQRIYHSHRVVLPSTSLRHYNSRPMSFLHVDDVALLDEMENLGDHHHGDMHLDIEDMSYEELLALGERIGNVNTGLSEETIATQLKTKTLESSTATINLEEEEEAASEDEETDSCIICLEEYKNQETIAILKCGHNYHADCLKKWLLLKNMCPICKSEALTP